MLWWSVAKVCTSRRSWDGEVGCWLIFHGTVLARLTIREEMKDSVEVAQLGGGQAGQLEEVESVECSMCSVHKQSGRIAKELLVKRH
jgi:hypothetical protein